MDIILNPLVTKDTHKEETTDALKDLTHMYDDFFAGHGIVDGLIDGMPKYRAVIDSTSDSFSSEPEGAAEYDAALKKNTKKRSNTCRSYLA